MVMLVRVCLSVAFLLVALFCVVGLLATLEPLPVQTQVVTRVVYGVVGAASIAGIVLLAQGGSTRRSRQSHTLRR